MNLLLVEQDSCYTKKWIAQCVARKEEEHMEIAVVNNALTMSIQIPYLVGIAVIVVILMLFSRKRK